MAGTCLRVRLKPGQTHTLGCETIASSSKCNGIFAWRGGGVPPLPLVTHESALQEVSPPVEENEEKEGEERYSAGERDSLSFPPKGGWVCFVVMAEVKRGVVGVQGVEGMSQACRWMEGVKMACFRGDMC